MLEIRCCRESLGSSSMSCRNLFLWLIGFHHSSASKFVQRLLSMNTIRLRIQQNDEKPKILCNLYFVRSDISIQWKCATCFYALRITTTTNTLKPNKGFQTISKCCHFILKIRLLFVKLNVNQSLHSKHRKI